MSLDTGSTDLTEYEAAGQIEGLLSNDEDGSADDEREPKAPTPKGEETEETEGETPEEETEEEPEGEDEESEEGDDEESKPATPRKLKVGDEELEEDEVVRGYLRQSDYTRKTQEVAAQRKQVAEKDAALRAERELYVTRLSQVEQVLVGQLPDAATLDRLRTENPAEYAATMADMQRNRDRLAAVDAERAKVLAKMVAQEEEAHQLRVSEERERLLAALPELKDAEKGKKLYAELQSAAQKFGFAPEELDGVVDHRPIVLLHKAMLYDRLVAERAEARKTVAKKVAAAPVLKPGTVAGGPNAKTIRAKKAVALAAKTGRIGDAANAIEALLD